MSRLFQLCRKYHEFFNPLEYNPDTSIQHFRKLLQQKKWEIKFDRHWSGDSKIWQRRWLVLKSLKMSPKLKSFMYQVFWQRIATHKYVANRSSKDLNSLCTICKPGVDETVTHLFLECKMAKLINKELCNLWNEWTGETLEFSQDWILLEVSKSKFKDTLRQFAVIAMWTTWNTRNLRDFQQIELTELGVKQYLYSEIRSWISTMHTDLQYLGLSSSTIQSRMDKVLLNHKVGSISNETLLFTEWSTRLVQDPTVSI